VLEAHARELFGVQYAPAVNSGKSSALIAASVGAEVIVAAYNFWATAPVAGAKLPGQIEPGEGLPEPQAELAQEPSVQTVPRWPSEGWWWEGGQEIAPSGEFDPRDLDTPLDRLTRSSGGRRAPVALGATALPADRPEPGRFNPGPAPRDTAH
jgi:hypothetical protein